MAPKAKRAASPGPKAKAKGKAKPAAEPDPKELAKKDAEEMWEKFEDGGAMKLKGFAEAVRVVNIKKCMIWGEEPGPIIGGFWKDSGGKGKGGFTKEEFVEWWPTLLEAAEAKVAELKEEDIKREEEKVKKAAEKAAIFEGTGVWKVPFTLINDSVEEAYKRGKTPFFIDDEEDHAVETYYTYSGALIVECKKMIMDKAKATDKTTIVGEILEEQRDKFFAAKCFKFGQTVVFRMANSACDIQNTFNSEAFPTHKLLDATEVKKMYGPDNADNVKGSAFSKMCAKKDDRDEIEMMGIHEKFRVVVITHFKEEDYEGFLKDMFPLDLVQPIKPFKA